MLCDDVIDEEKVTVTTTTIEQLCDNILLDVFSHLNVKSLKNASLVNKKWNELIGSSALIMREFRFRIGNERRSIRNYQNFAIKTTTDTDWSTIGASIRLSSVRSFHIQGGRFCETIYSDELFPFLSSLTELEELSFENVRLIDGTNETVRQCEMPRLKTLRIVGDDFTILGHIDTNELQQLQCISKCNNQSNDFECIAQSMVRFHRMERLTLWNCMEIFEYINVQQVKCHLNFFEVYHINVSPMDTLAFEQNLQKFLLLQTDSLVDLKFDCSMLDVDDGQKMVKDFLRTSFNKCTRLTSLDIRNLSIPRDECFYQSLLPNYSIRNLQVHWGFDGAIIEFLLKLCPKLSRLEADMCRLNGDSLNTIATFCPELNYLHTFMLTGCIETGAVFEHLKYLSISKIEPTTELVELMSRCSKLEQIRTDECWNAKLLMDAAVMVPSIRKLRISNKCYDILREGDADENGRRDVKQLQQTNGSVL